MVEPAGELAASAKWSICLHRDRKRLGNPCSERSYLSGERRARGVEGVSGAVVRVGHGKSPEKTLGKVVTGLSSGNPDLGTCLLLPRQRLGVRGGGHPSGPKAAPGGPA